MINKILPRKWSGILFYNGISAHRTRDILFKLCKTARGSMKCRGNNTNINDADGIFRLRTSMGEYVIMRGSSNNEFNKRYTIYRDRHSAIYMGGIHSRGANTDKIL